MPRKAHCYFYIYKTTNLINQKFYIGMHATANLDDGYLGSGTHLRRSIRKYGKENFKKEIVEFCTDRDSLAKREFEIVNPNLIKEDLCMNLRTGGFGGDEFISGLGGLNSKKSLSKEDKIRIFKKCGDYTFKNKKGLFSEKYLNHIKNYGGSTKGRKMSQEQKLKIGKANSILQNGEKNSQFGKIFKFINNGLITKKILLSELQEYLDNNWILGRLDKKFKTEHPQFGMKFKCINNGLINKKIQVQYLQEYLDNNWILGRLNFKKSNDKLPKLNKKINGKGENNTQFGKVWIYNLDLKLCKSIFKDELENYLNQNWIKGRKIKF